MAMDQDTLDHYDPIIAALQARIEALESGTTAQNGPPQRQELVWDDGTKYVYELVEP